MNDKLPISVCIPVKNEEKNLPNCLSAIGNNFAEIIVVDSLSSDATVAVAESFGAKVVDFAWNGSFPKKRNWLLENYNFQTDWVLFLDADEIINSKFLIEIRQAVRNSRYVGYWLKFTNSFMGRELHFGDTFIKLSLFRRSAGRYERLPESLWSKLDMEIHEHPILNGQTGNLATRILHTDYRGLEHYIDKHNQYSSWEANRFNWLHQESNSWAQLNSRQKFKYRYLDRWWFALFYFASSYIAKFGFLDGMAGLQFAFLKMRYFADIRLKILEHQKQPPQQLTGNNNV